jgi:protein SCO1/2
MHYLIRTLPALTLGLALAVSAAEHAGHEHHHHGAAAGDGADPHAHHKAMMNKPAEAEPSADIDLRDRTLVDQDGQEVRFVSDVIGDKIVVMDFVYTTCTTVCPVLSAVFVQLQERLGDQLGQEVALVSVTVDPVRDTPQRLKAYSARYEARDGWVWLTGPKTTVDDVLTGVGAYSVNFEDHPSMVLVGDGSTGQWSRFFGFPSPDRIMEQVNALQAARQGTAGG